jgi:hypothetical protein
MAVANTLAQANDKREEERFTPEPHFAELTRERCGEVKVLLGML